MHQPDTFMSVMIASAGSLPYLLAYLAGIVFSLATWKNHPQVSTVALIGFVLLLANLIAGVGLHVWLVTAAEQGSELAHSARLHGLLNVLRGIFAAIGYAFLITAVFGWRGTSAKG